MPLPVAVAGGITAIGLAADVLGIYSFFADGESDEERQRDIDTIKADVDDLQSAVGTTINTIIAQSLGQASTALDNLALYRASEDANARDVLANNAILSSQDALNAIREQAAAISGDASIDTLAYGFGALHYAIAVRMMVANTVQDGIVGGAGVHLSIKQAADLLLNITDDGNDLIGAMTREIAESISVEGDENFIGTSVDIVVSNSLTSARTSFTVTRESGFADTFPFLPFVESTASYRARAEARADAAAEDMYDDLVARFGIQNFLNTGGDVNAWLAQSPLNVSDLYEYVGSNANDDIDTGTSRADYFTGLGGDDQFFGGNGPDAISGGSGNDILQGGALQDMIRGGTGNDMMFGNETFDDPIDGDTARFEGLSTDYTVSGGSEYAIVSGPDGEKDKLFNIEFLRFDDTVQALGDGSYLDVLSSTRAFDVEERVALIYEAALNRDGAIDLPGLNFYITVTERDNLTDAFIAADMMNSPEFADNFGDPDLLSNEAFLERIYLNVLDRESDAAGRQFYLDLLNDGTITKAVALADIATSPENVEGSGEVLMSLFENSNGQWRFALDDGMAIA